MSAALLQELLAEAATVGWTPDIPVDGLEYDSRKVEPGSAFFAFPGERVDGHDYIDSARGRGAVAVVSERPKPEQEPLPWAQVEHGRQAMARAALAFYERPDQKLKLIAVTGTNGKTTTVYLIDSILQAAGFKTARLGTIEHKVGDRTYPAVNTTPESLDMVRYFSELAEQGGTHACFEASSHALEIGRVFGFEIDTAVFTNLSQDHLDLHDGMEGYERAKRKLFEGAGAPPPKHAVINSDDEAGRRFLQIEGPEPLAYGDSGAVRATHIEATYEGLTIEIETPDGPFTVKSPLAGLFNVSNILAAVGVALAQGIDHETISRGVAALTAVPGRFEAVREGQDFLCVVDYAHTDDALRNLIESARAIAGKGRIITVFGCGGDRDRTKRPRMGAVAGELSDRVILTSDNPRTEDPLRILADTEVGLQRVDADYAREPNRYRAIEQALAEAQPGDVVLIAGKGHETYQIIGTEKLPFDDRATARDLLRKGRDAR